MTCPVNPDPEVPGRRAEVLIDGEHVLIAIPPELDHLVAPDLSRYSIALEDPMTEPTDHNLDVLHQRTASGQKQFLRFVENNENEGEGWRFWLQVLGNEDELRRLWSLLDNASRDQEDFPYVLADLDADGTVPESEVDVLVQHTDSGYMAYEHKVTGKFTCPDDLGEYAHVLYKGGIKEMFA